MIKGWKAIEAFTGMKQHRIRRAIGHYGFPKPYPVKESQSTNGRVQVINAWNLVEVCAWMHQELKSPTLPPRP